MYAKLFLQIFDSSIAENPDVRVTFMDMLILANRHGVVDMTHEAIARRTNRPLELIRSTIAIIEQPDPSSRTPHADGCRIKRLDAHRDWGWMIVNYDTFNKIASEEQRQEKTRERVKSFRAKSREDSNGSVTQCNAPVTQRTQEKRMKRHVAVPVPVDVDVTKQPSPSAPRAPNGWSLWVDANRALNRQDPSPDGIDLAASKRFFIAARSNAEELMRIYMAYLADRSHFIIEKGFQLRYCVPDKYRNQPVVHGPRESSRKMRLLGEEELYQ